MIKVGDKVKIDEKSYFFIGKNLFDVVAINGLKARIKNSDMTLFVLIENLELVADEIEYMTKEEFKNLEVGKTFSYKGKILQINKNEKNYCTCTGCYFRNYLYSECLYLYRQGIIPQCTSLGRKDRNNVIFKEVE